MTHHIETPERMQIVERMAALGPKFVERAACYERDAVFPTENWNDMKAAGLLGICIPKDEGGLGADFGGDALTSAELGRHCATTGLTFNMHVATTLLVGQIADDMTLTDDERATLVERRALLRKGVVENGTIHSQPFSEGLMAGASNVHNVACSVEGDGVEIEGGWDPLGMRGTDSRNLVMTDVFVPAGNERIPPGMFGQAAQRWPYFYMTLSFSYLGMMRGILDAAGAYLRGDGSPTARRDHPIKQQGWAQMNLIYDQARALCYDVLGECGSDPTPEMVRRAWSSMVTTMRGAHQSV